MATFTLSAGHGLTVGTELEAFDANPLAAPKAAKAKVSKDGTVKFTGLTPATRYVAAPVDDPDRKITFTTKDNDEATRAKRAHFLRTGKLDGDPRKRA